MTEKPGPDGPTIDATGEFIVTVIATGTSDGPPVEVRLRGDVARLGRVDDCEVVVKSPTVSRRHAEIRRTPEGFLLVDCGSANGVWVGSERVSQHRLRDGQEFRLGSALLRFTVCAPESSAAPEAAGATPARSDGAVSTPLPKPSPEVAPPVVRPVPSGELPPSAPSVEAHPEPAAAPQRTPPAIAPRIEPPPPLGAEPVVRQPEPQPPAPAPEPSAPEEARPAVSPLVEFFQTEGELVVASGNKPFLLDGKDNAWFLETGKIEVFTVALEGMEPTGSRSHFLSVVPGQIMLGMDLAGFGMGSGFLVVGRMGTNLRRIPVRRLQQLARNERYRPELAALLDGWVSALSKSLTKEFTPGPIVDVALSEGEEPVLENQKKAKPGKGVVWLEVAEGNLLFIGMEELQFETVSEGAKVGAQSGIGLASLFEKAQKKRTVFPVAFDTWVEASNAGGTATTLRTFAAESLAGDPGLWRGLDLFHRVLCQCEFINKKLAVVDEFNRLKSKAEYAEAAREEALRDIALVLEQPVHERAAALIKEEGDPTFVACQLVGEALGMTVRDHPEANKQAGFDLRVGAIGRASRFRTRVVALRDDWWRHDQGPLLAKVEKTDEPLALLPTGPSSYECVNPKAGTRGPVSAGVATEIAPFGFAFYRPFPEGILTARDLIQYGIRGLMGDVWMLLLMGLAMGLLGSLTPYFTGRLFDTAIPQADRNLLFQFTLGLFVAALVSASFKITQSIAVLRIQGKMDYSIQAALWDRLLNLPSTFFRQFSAGDLADRAGGIDAIRGLLAGAGISAILGTVSSIFYVFLMFKYSGPLAFLAMGLTVIFVGFTTVSNYLQLRFQREQMQIRGRLTGLVLQLVSGVGKLRVAGAENHAFRVWAREFSNQRRLEFKAGRIKNNVQVFSSGFAIISNMAVFFTLVAVQRAAAAKGSAPSMTTGDFIAFTAAYGAFLTAMQSLSEASLNVLRVVPIWERLKPILSAPAETDETKTYPGRLKGGVEVSHIHFRYSEEAPWVLNDLTVKIEPGEFVAFVGSSGCGKSTLMRMLLGFETPERGALFLDGQDLASLDLREVRQQIGVVLQDSKLLPVDIFRNIVGVATDLGVDDAWEAARLSGLEEDVRALPMGMHTYVSEGGGGFSGGQQQKLLIARALVRRPRILIFDEATSALDNRSQATVMESVEKLQATRIVIAHRLSTIINADRICYLDAGKIVEMGSYDELMKLDGKFSALARRQMA